MKQLAYIILFCLYSISSFGASTNKIDNYLNLNRSNGLCNNQIHCIQEDTYSRIWIGTFRGLEIYTPSGGLHQNKRYSEEFVMSMLNSEDNMIIGTNQRLEVYNYKKGIYTRILDQNDDIKNVISSITIDSTIVLIDHTNIYIMVNNKIVDKKLKLAQYHHIIKDKYNYIWAVSSDRIDKLDRDGNLIKTYYLPNQRDDIGGIESMSIFICSNNYIWVGTLANGLFKYNRQTDSFGKVTSSLNNEIENIKYISSINEDNENRLWVYSIGKVYIYDYINDTLKRYMLADYPNTITLCSYKSSANKMFIGCSLKGLFVIGELHSTFQFYRNEKQSESADSRIVINNIQMDAQSNMWATTDGHGVVVFDKEKKFVKSYNENNSIISNTIVSIAIDNKGNKWLGSAMSGLYRLNNDNKITKFNNDDSDSTSLGGNSVHVLHQLSEDTLIIASTQNIDIYANNEFKHLLPENSQYHHQQIFSNYKSIYFIHVYGVIELDRSALSIKHHTDNNLIFSCGHLSDNGQLWLGTPTGELYRVENGAFIPELNNDSKFNNQIVGINSDSDDQLWITTRSSLYSLNKDKTISEYDLNWGLKGFEFTGRSTYRDNNGMLYFGLEGSILTFNPKKVNIPHTSDVQLFFSELLLDNKVIEPNETKTAIISKHINNIDTLIFNDYSNNILLNVETISNRLNLINNSKIIYKLSGIDKKYQEINPSSNQIILNNLPAGEYKLNVKVTDNNGTELDSRNILIIIKPHFLYSNPMKILYLLVFLTILYISIYVIKMYILNKQQSIEAKKNQEVITKINAMKVGYLSHIASDFKTPLTIMSMLQNDLSIDNETNLIYKRSLNQLEFSAMRMTSFINIASNDRINIEKVDIIKYIKELDKIFKPLYIQKQIKHSLNSDIESLSILIDINKIELMLSTLLSKNIKELSIRSECNTFIEHTDSNLIISISNNDTYSEENISDSIYEQNHGVVGGIDTEIISFIAEILSIKIATKESHNSVQTMRITIPINYSDNEDIVNDTDFTFANTIAENTLLVDFAEDNGKITESNKEHINRYNVVIIDDNYEILKVIKRKLTPHYKVYITTSPLEAFQVLKYQNIDIIVCDHKLSESYEIYNQIKMNPSLINIPVVIMSENTSSESKISILESGANVLISKPIVIDELNLQINILLKHKQSLRSYYENVFNSNIPLNDINNADEVFIMELKQYIINNLSNPKLSINSISDHLKVSRTQLYLKVKAITKLFPSQFILNIKMEAAKKLLLESDISSAEISHKLGYCNPSHFTRQFKMFYNVSPREFRKETDLPPLDHKAKPE